MPRGAKGYAVGKLPDCRHVYQIVKQFQPADLALVFAFGKVFGGDPTIVGLGVWAWRLIRQFVLGKGGTNPGET